MAFVDFYDNSFTISSSVTGFTVSLAQPITLSPTTEKRVDRYVFRDRTCASVDIGKSMDRLEITGFDFMDPNATYLYFPYNFPFGFGMGTYSMMKYLNDMVDAGSPVYVNNLATVIGIDPGYTGYFFITKFSYIRKAGAVQRFYYNLTLDSVT